jgi:hypothetical protein
MAEHKGRGMNISRWLVVQFALAVLAIPLATFGQMQRDEAPGNTAHAEQLAKILRLTDVVNRAHLMHQQDACGAPASVEELSMRQDILETVVASSFEVDGVLAELENERAHLSEISSVLQGRRDHAVNLLNVANLVTGTGLGIAVNAMQFSSSTANLGDGIGVGSGIGSTVLSIVGIRRQHGPVVSVGRIPNMLAPLFQKQAALNAYYPPEVMEYLKSVPPGESEQSGSRIEQLMAEWQKSGRIGLMSDKKAEKKVELLTSSLDAKTKLSIDDISDRIAMLGDVTGRVSLMKRDLAELMLSVRSKRDCAGK